jgi:Flp pilus assembly protein TadG
MHSRWWKRFAGAEQGLAMVEFALILPIMMTLFYGTVEVSRYILVTQKVEKLAHSVADVTGQEQIATQATLNQVMAASSDIMNPFSLSTNGKVIISSLYRPSGSTSVATVNWRYEGGGTFAATSLVGALGAIPIVPGGFTFDERENLISAEVFYQFSPLLTTRFFGTVTIYRVAFYKPRFGALLTAPT